MISFTASGIATLVNLRLSNCIFYCCVKTQHTNILLQQLWWTGYQGRNFGYGYTSVSAVMWKLWVRVWNQASALLWKMNFWQQVTALARTIFTWVVPSVVPKETIWSAKMPRNSIPSVTNPPAEKWVELRRQFSEGVWTYGEAFFDFFHVKKCIERNNEETPLLCAVENISPDGTDLEPLTFDMKDAQGSAQHRLAINKPLPANWQSEKHDRTLFQRDTKQDENNKVPAYLEHYSVVQLTQKTAKKKKKLSSDLRSSWKLREAVGSADEDSDGISEETGHIVA
ncbi:hypothetical protein DAPPUDRAFT_117648 [Daphnia pulex]|uniref:Uncharacterized protein n=1 Tax=Daphnia pulex TaxID=6669 RepID=E9HTC9_DAPPU|nr:hypothetical protein DAPPUDRAFT_117648 [Daphnia pulex]|eukprot:EFX65003.1 hypothetical protein DAPPUDRAFT_117648 [Daphnia pulex]